MNKKLESIKIDFDSLKVGDKVWNTSVGECDVTGKGKSGSYYIELLDKSGDRIDITKDGRDYVDGEITTFKSNPFDLISEYPKEMMVSNDHASWKKRMVIGHIKSSEKYIAITADENSVSVCKYAKDIPEPTEREKEIEQLKAELKVLQDKINQLEVK